MPEQPIVERVAERETVQRITAWLRAFEGRGDLRADTAAYPVSMHLRMIADGIDRKFGGEDKGGGPAMTFRHGS